MWSGEGGRREKIEWGRIERKQGEGERDGGVKRGRVEWKKLCGGRDMKRMEAENPGGGAKEKIGVRGKEGGGVGKTRGDVEGE